MRFSSYTAALIGSAALIEARSLQSDPVFGHFLKGRADNSLTLSSDALQVGSTNDGSDEIGAAEVGQAKSLTSNSNFINNCAGKTLTNGLQITTGSCNGITMGDIPAKTNMVSSVITFPLPGSSDVQSDVTFNITVQMINLVAGSFTNADATYYSAPQQLENGLVVGHTHVTVQDMGNSLNPTTPLDPTKFAFFKGINDAGNGKGLLTATVTGGLPAGNYRVCTMASASNHQPVLMPVAQRGTPDDCTKFTVSGSGTTENASANDGANGIKAAALAASAVAAGPNFSFSQVGSAAASGATSAADVQSTTANGSKDTTTTAATADSTSTNDSKDTTTTAAGSKTTTDSKDTTTTAAGSKSTTDSKDTTTTADKATTTAAAESTSTSESKDTTTKAADTTTSEGKGVSTAFTSFSNSTTTAASNGNGIGGGKGRDTSTVAAATTTSVAKDTTTSAAKDTTTSVAKDTTTSVAKDTTTSINKDTTTTAGAGTTDVSATSVAAVQTTSASLTSKGGKAQATGSGDSELLVELETFFEFLLSLGGLPPSVGKKGDQFFVFEEIFEDLSSAASAACGKQHETCISLSGPNFAAEECEIQQSKCTSAAVTASATATSPATITATVTVPATATASVTGVISVISTPSSVAAATTAAATKSAIVKDNSAGTTTAAAVVAHTSAAAVLGSSESVCSAVTMTVTVSPPKATGTDKQCALATSTVTVFTSAAVATGAFSYSNSTTAAF